MRRAAGHRAILVREVRLDQPREDPLIMHCQQVQAAVVGCGSATDY